MKITSLQTPLRLDHLAIWVDDMPKMIEFLTDVVGWKQHPMVIEVDESDPTIGGMKAVFIEANGLWLELIEPTTPGPGMDILNKRGGGCIVEANFEAIGPDYATVLEVMANQGIQMLSMDGSPLANEGLIYEGVQGMEETAETGQQIAYWPTSITGGTTIEVYARDLNDDTNLLNVRDKQWTGEMSRPGSPRMHHVVIMIKDMDRAASFYTEVLGLKRSPANFDIESTGNENIGAIKLAFINSGNEKVWLELCQPTGEGAVMDYMVEKGEGQMVELVVEVDDIASYYDSVRAKGVQLVDIGGTPISEEEKYQTVQPYGEKIAYFPSDVACGLTIEVIERGPRETSIVHRLYDTAL